MKKLIFFRFFILIPGSFGDLLFVKKKIGNVTRTRGARRGGAKRAPRVRVTFLIFFTHLGSCFGMNGHPGGLPT